MNGGIKTALGNSKANVFQLRAALFHSTPVLERKRRNYWDSKSNNFTKRYKTTHGKQTLLRNVSAYADLIFQSWKDELEDDDNPFSTRGPSWFRKQFSGQGPRQDRAANQGPHRRGRNFQFLEDDIDVETIFQSSFGGNRFFYWSFINEDNPQWRSSSQYSNNNGRFRNWRYQFQDEYNESCDDDDDDESQRLESSNLASQRLTLGLSRSGPLKLEDVKNAYRACALKWHPDRHQGSSKVAAKEKFKRCSAAYQIICDKLVVN